MKREVSFRVNNGKIDVLSTVRLKDIASTLPNGQYIASIENEPLYTDQERFRKHFFKGVDIVAEETANKKDDVILEVKRTLIREMLKEEDAVYWVNDKVNGEEEFSLTWLTPRGWQVLLRRFKVWAYNICDCYI